MYLLYIDDSGDNVAHCQVFSVVAIKDSSWHEAYEKVKNFRRALNVSHGIPVSKEFHAWKLVSGRGDLSRNRIIFKSERAEIFKNYLRLIADLPSVRLFNAFSSNDPNGWLFERLMNRLNRTLLEWGEYGIIISDRGKELYYSTLRRRMGAFNPIPSAYGVWPDGDTTRNIPIVRIVEDLFFKAPEHSHFIQMADAVAFALLRREVPLESRTRYGLDVAFNLVRGVTVGTANRRDRDGIIRVP